MGLLSPMLTAKGRNVAAQQDGWFRVGRLLPVGSVLYAAERVELYGRRGGVLFKLGRTCDLKRRSRELCCVPRFARYVDVDQAVMEELELRLSCPFEGAGRTREWFRCEPPKLAEWLGVGVTDDQMLAG